MKEQKYTSDDEKNMFSFLKLMGIGLAVIVSIILVSNYLRKREYPDLVILDSLNNVVDDVRLERGSALVTFDSKKKYRIFWILKSNSVDPHLVEIITVGDLISKETNSDTLTIKHEGREYLYFLKEVE